MPSIPDQGPSRPRRKDIERAPEIAEAGRLLFGVFGEVADGVELPSITQELVAEHRLYNESSGDPIFVIDKERKSWKYRYSVFPARTAETSRSAPDSPIIYKVNVEGARKILTVTISHHWLAGTPDKNFVFAQDPEEGGIRSYWYKRERTSKSDNPFHKLESWIDVRGLLLFQPEDRWDSGPRMDFWKIASGKEHYRLEASLDCKGMSLLELFERLGESASNA
jgi:hypothetical protein